MHYSDHLENRVTLENAQQFVAHESARTTGIYDGITGSITLDEVEKIAISAISTRVSSYYDP